MEYITTTNLRTQSSQLANALKNGDKIRLIHRSKLVGIIEPIREPKPFDAAGFREIVKDLHLSKTTPTQRDKIYRKHMMEKYGKGLPRR